MRFTLNAGTRREFTVECSLVIKSEYRYFTEYFTVVPSHANSVSVYRPTARQIRNTLLQAVAHSEMKMPAAHVVIMPPTAIGIQWQLHMSASSLRSVLNARAEHELLNRARIAVVRGENDNQVASQSASNNRSHTKTQDRHPEIFGRDLNEKSELELWKTVRDLASDKHDELKQAVDAHIKRIEAGLLHLWEILVPVKSNEGILFSEDHHESFRRILRGLPGNNGTTRRPAGHGDWTDPRTGEAKAEEMIPIRFRACRADAERMAEHARKFYDQFEVIAYLLTSESDIIVVSEAEI